MTSPIDYTAALRGVPNPTDAFLQNFQGFSAVRQADLQQQQQEAALAQQQQMRSDLAELSMNPTPAAISRMSVRYPQLSEQFKRSYDMLNQQQQENKVAAAIPVYAALQSGRPEVASKQLRDTAAAMENSGQSYEAKRTLAWADMIDQHPEQAKLTSGLLLSSVMGADKFAETFGKLGQEGRAADLHPTAMREGAANASEAESKAITAGIEAKYADQSALLDLQKKGWDITKIKEDIGISKEANRIALMNARANQETNNLKRAEMETKVQDARRALDDKIREKVSTAESGAANIDNMLNTIERIKSNKALPDVVGSIEGSKWYPTQVVQAGAKVANLANPFYTPTTGDDRADAVALIDTLGSQAFLAQIPSIKGMGALSNAEGEKLQSALTNLSRAQSEKQFRANLDEAARILNKGRESLSKATGVPLGKPDTPAAPGSRPPIDSFFKN